jgi:DNA-binding response OmpR family regulator
MLVLAGCTVDLQRAQVVRGESTLTLTTRELDLLRYLVEHRSQVVSREQLLAEVWGYSDTVVSRASDNTVRRLREKIERDPTRPDHVLTVHGVGYRFELPGEVEEIAPPASRVLSLGPVRVDLTRRRAVGPSGELGLTEPEAALLEALIEAEGAVVDRRTLARAGWQGKAHGARIVDAAVAQLRAKLELEPDAPRWLLTVRNRGYRLAVPEPPAQADAAELVGRQALEQQVLAAVAPGRWVLLLGPAGIGKSSLARRVMGARPALWLDLAAAQGPMDACTAAARALEILPGGADPVERIGSALARRAGELVVLDNLEGLGAAARDLIEAWRAAAPGVAWLGTSRVRVGAEGEEVIEVGPLEAEDAVELFLRWAESASSAGRALRRQRPEVRQLVERLDRVPLALALAAARTPVLGVAQLHARLKVDLLHRQGGDPRHSSLRLAIDSSLRAVPAEALEALQLMAGFRDGFDLDDAEGLLGPDAVDLLQTLRDHSLLRAEPASGALRFSVWEAVREVLGEVERTELVLRRCTWMGRAGEPEVLQRLGWDSHLRQSERLLEQGDDVARAARTALALGEVELAARCAAAGGWAYVQQGPYAEGVALIDQVLQAEPSGPMRAWLHLVRAQLEQLLGQADRSVESYARAGELGAEYGLEWLACEAPRRQARMLRHLGQLDAIRPVLTCAIERSRQRGARDGQLEFAESWMALLDEAPAQREAWLRRALARGRQAGNRPLVLDVLASMADLAHKDGRLQEAFDRLQLQDEIGMLGRRMRVQNVLGRLALAMYLDDDAEVERLFPLARAAAVQLGSPMDEIDALHSYAQSLISHDQLAQAQRLLEEADALLGSDPGYEKLEAQLGLLWSDLHLRAGRFAEALLPAERSAELYRALGRPDGASIADKTVAVAHLALGELALARAALDRPGAPARLSLPHALCARALLAHAEGRHAERDALFEQCRHEVLHRGYTVGPTHPELVAEVFGPWATRLL